MPEDPQQNEKKEIKHAFWGANQHSEKKKIGVYDYYFSMPQYVTKHLFF